MIFGFIWALRCLWFLRLSCLRIESSKANMINFAFYNAKAVKGCLKGFIMFVQWLISVIAFCLFTYVVYYIYETFFSKEELNNIDDEDDFFCDNAPLPKSPSPLPPIQDEIQNEETLEQMQFKAFMKKMKEEQEKERVAILRE